MKGFTLVEISVIVFIILILASIGLVSFRSYQQNLTLNGDAGQIVSTLRLAQNQTTSSLNASAYGVHFDNNQHVLFVGSTYNPSDLANRVSPLSSGIEIYNINLSGNGSEVIFNRLNGRTEEWGSVSLRVIADQTKTKTIYITFSGQISFIPPPASTTGRIIDSRHMHFNYSRSIDVNSENIILTFSNPSGPPVSQSISISENLDANGQISWQGTVNVGGDNQVVSIATLRLNSSDTIFCIHRDRRYNDKALSISLSGDSDNTLINYAADGTTTPGTSIYVSNIQEQ
ncbi:MAG: hypothetical protein HY813_01780 [Candidatus Portnoybacteria bacterium]|nr:hypothetical protein [Candidatus Portnoybacteria bacterium]